jgi:hypothetical protein
MENAFVSDVEHIMLKAMSRSEAARVAANARWGGEMAGTGPAADWQQPYKDPRRPANYRKLQGDYRKGIQLYKNGKNKVPPAEQAKFDAMDEQIMALRGRKKPATGDEVRNMRAYHRSISRMLEGDVPQDFPPSSDWMPSVAAVAPINRKKAERHVTEILRFFRNVGSERAGQSS